MKASLNRHLAPRLLPNGQTYCLELAATEAQQDDCAGDLEDGFFLAEQDKHRALVLVDLGLERIAISRLPPCHAWQIKCQLDRRAQLRAIDDKLEALGGHPPP